MTFDDLQQQWQGSNESSAQQPVNTNALLRTFRRAEKLKSTIFRRDMIESIAAIFVIISFGKGIVSLTSWMAKSGAFICVCSAIWIIYKLHHTRKVQGESRLELSVREYFQMEIQRAEKQIHLLRTIASWYIAPCMLGANLVFAGSSRSWEAIVAYLLTTLLLSWGIYALNQRAVDKELVPVYDELKSQLNELSEPNIDESETNI